MNGIIVIVCGVALLVEGYLFNQKEQELRDKIAELQDNPTEAQCVHAMNVCVAKYIFKESGL